jgi:hypothetical protein
MQDEPTSGKYRHYKGGEYRVIGTARHSETDELLVVYRCLYDNDSLWVRPLAMFMEKVTIDGQEQSRFTRCGTD